MPASASTLTVRLSCSDAASASGRADSVTAWYTARASSSPRDWLSSRLMRAMRAR